MDIKEFLKANGASDEDLKALTEGAHAKSLASAFEKMEARAVKAEEERQAALRESQAAGQKVADYDKWFQDVAVPERQQIENELLQAKADAARNAALIEEAQKKGLIDVAKMAGFNTEEASRKAAEASAAAGLDPKKFVTYDKLVEIAHQEGEAIAMAQDIAAEHSVLFPGKPLRFRDLRKEAVDRRMSVEALWMEKYGVAQAREAREKSLQDAEIAKWKAEGAKEKETELVSKYGNPDTRPLAPSVSPFARRASGSGRDGQPWQNGDRSEQRVMDATKKVVAQLTQ